MYVAIYRYMISVVEFMYVLYMFQYSSFSLGNKILQHADVSYSSNYHAETLFLFALQ